jgi:murein DD-endopeptidase MepM/ murein hydrolase activator NlpD
MIGLMHEANFLRVIRVAVYILFSLIFISDVSQIKADTTQYRSAGWVYTSTFNTPYTNLSGCQKSDDGLYCSRPIASLETLLYFGSFSDLEEYGIPLNSTINKLKIRIKGKSSGTHLVTIAEGYHNINYRSICQNPSRLISFNLGPTETMIEKSYDVTSINGLINCINLKNINFRNLTFILANELNSNWYADIDNFEIAFDYTPPIVTPTPVYYPPDQNGYVWEIGADKSNIIQEEQLDNIVSISTGDFHSLALKKDGTVWAWGKNEYGQLGIGTSGDEVTIPTQVKNLNGSGFLTDVKSIGAGNRYSIALKNDGTIWTWGNNEGRLRGVGSIPPGKLLYPVQVVSGFFSNVIAIAAGGFHSLALNADGTIVAWGSNNVGQLGTGCTRCSIQVSPLRTKNIENVKSISAGSSHSLAVKNDGTVWGWGKSGLWELSESGLIDDRGEVFLPIHIAELSDIKEISSKEHYNLAIDNEGRVLEWGGEYRLRKPIHIIGIEDAHKISAGQSAISFGVKGYAIKDDKTLWQLYINDIPPRQVPILKNVIAVSSGTYTPALVVVNTTSDVLGDSTIKPFLDLPWNYKGKGLSFNDAALSINSFFDHAYPFLSTALQEPIFTSGLFQNYDPRNQVTTFRNEKSLDFSYTKHDGYDYGKAAKVFVDEPQLAAGNGTAKYVYTCGACGKAVHIDHLNGYQTRYYHLNSVAAKIKNASEPIRVDQGEQIGTTGFTGNVRPNGEGGAHIHFMVIQDKNNDGNFEDNIPDGLIDPFGWQSKDEDPWEKYTFNHLGIDRAGNKSNYLWKMSLDGLKAAITSNGGSFKEDKFTIEIPKDTISGNLTLEMKPAPKVKPTPSITSIGSIMDITLKNALGDFITFLNKPLYLVIDLGENDLLDYKPGTIAIYSSKDKIQWKKEITTLDLQNKKATAEIDHLTYFALMGEPSDIISPITEALLEGNVGEQNWFRSNIKALFDAKDNAGGLGVEYTAYQLGTEDWQTYDTPLIFSEERDYNINYYSEDIAGNVEEGKSIKFQIDKTKPKTNTQIIGTKGDVGWYVSDVKINLHAEDTASGVVRTEYSLDDGQTYNTYSSELHIDKEGVSNVLYRSIDKAGNIEDIKETNIKIDKTPPNTLVYRSGQRGIDQMYYLH